MSKFERIVCVAVPNIIGVILVIIGKRVIAQTVATTISSTVVMMGEMLICTGLICVSLSCIAYALVRPSLKMNGKITKETTAHLRQGYAGQAATG